MLRIYGLDLYEGGVVVIAASRNEAWTKLTTDSMLQDNVSERDLIERPILPGIALHFGENCK